MGFPLECDGNYFLDKIFVAAIRLLEFREVQKSLEIESIQDIISEIVKHEKNKGNISS